MSDCDDVIGHIYELLNRHDLAAGAEADLRRHIEACRCCFDRYEFERRLLERLKGSGGCSCPESLRVRIKAIVEKF